MSRSHLRKVHDNVWWVLGRPRTDRVGAEAARSSRAPPAPSASNSLRPPPTRDSAQKESKMEFGLYTFADVGPEIDPARRLHNLLEEIELADQLGLDVFGVGEHHRPDYAVSSPAVTLAAAATRTKDIRLTSAVTVLSSDDPVRVFQDSDTLDLLLKVRESERVTWSGKHRAPLEDAGVYPRPLQDPLPVWIAVGGTPQSVVRAALLGLPLAIAIIGGQPEHFVPLARLYREAARRAGHDPARLPISINSHTFVAETSKQAADEFFP